MHPTKRRYLVWRAIKLLRGESVAREWLLRCTFWPCVEPTGAMLFGGLLIACGEIAVDDMAVDRTGTIAVCETRGLGCGHRDV